MTPSRNLMHEIKQTRPFRSQSQEVAVALMLTADRIRRSIDATIESHGITPQQYNVLRILRGAGDKGLPTLEIAARMIEETPGITRLLDRLETRSFVRRERCPTDRRQVLCWITSKGIDLVAELDAPVDVADRKALHALNKRELSDLLRLLEKVREGLHKINNESEQGVARSTTKEKS